MLPGAETILGLFLPVWSSESSDVAIAVQFHIGSGCPDQSRKLLFISPAGIPLAARLSTVCRSDGAMDASMLLQLPPSGQFAREDLQRGGVASTSTRKRIPSVSAGRLPTILAGPKLGDESSDPDWRSRAVSVYVSGENQHGLHALQDSTALTLIDTSIGSVPYGPAVRGAIPCRISSSSYQRSFYQVEREARSAWSFSYRCLAMTYPITGTGALPAMVTWQVSGVECPDTLPVRGGGVSRLFPTFTWDVVMFRNSRITCSLQISRSTVQSSYRRLGFRTSGEGVRLPFPIPQLTSA